MSFRKLIAGAEFTAQVLRQLIVDLNYNFEQITDTTPTTPTITLNAGSSSTTAVMDEQFTLYEIDTSGGNRTLTLPAASSVAGKALLVKKRGASSSLTIARAGSDLIDGSVSVVLSTEYTSRFLVSTGSTWYSF